MTTNQAIRLNETVLLLLQRQMDGDTSTLRFDVQLAALRGATFKGEDGYNIHSASPVRETDDAGRIDLIKFRVVYPGETEEPERNVLLKIDEKGRINCQTPVQPQLLDSVIAELEEIYKVEDYLTPLSEHIDADIENFYYGAVPSEKDSYRHNTNYAFDEVITEYFDTQNLAEAETRLFKSMIANIGLELCEQGIPPVSDYNQITPLSNPELPIDGSADIQQFFEYGAERKGNSDIDFGELVAHINYVSEQSWDRPIDTLNEILDMYDFN